LFPRLQGPWPLGFFSLWLPTYSPPPRLKSSWFFFPSLENGHGFFFFSITNYKNTVTLIILFFINFFPSLCLSLLVLVKRWNPLFFSGCLLRVCLVGIVVGVGVFFVLFCGTSKNVWNEPTSAGSYFVLWFLHFW
jgi:hypothetical protein